VEDKQPIPPKSITSLRALSVEIAKGNSEIRLGRKAQVALNRLVELEGDPALLSITRLAKKLGVHPATLTRLSKRLGYHGFSGLQAVLLDAAFNGPSTFYSRQAQAALSSGENNQKARLNQLCQENLANIDQLMETVDMAQFQSIVHAMTKARRIVIQGVRQMRAPAVFLQYGLALIRSDVALLDTDSPGVAESLSVLSRDDLLICVSCNPYSRQSILTTTVAAEERVPVAVLTDSMSSPLLKQANWALLVPHETSFLSNSLVTFIALAECLINAYAAANPESAEAALRKRDEMIHRLGVETN
jgi:DNA-binding MurR/RpiR family transcriptional regulator